jgi:tetratricopeptide (TPR) repeat protein
MPKHLKKFVLTAFLLAFFVSGQLVQAETLRSEIARLINEGINYHSNRNYLLAIKSFKQADDLEPGNEQILSNLSIAHNNYGKYLAERTDGAGASREFRNALYFNPNNDVARSNLEYKLKELNVDIKDPIKRLLEAKKERIAENFFAAIAELREVNRIKESSDAYIEIGTNYHLLALKSNHQNNYIDDAIAAFEKAHQINANDPNALVKLGDVHVATGKVNKGIDYYERAIKIAPDNEAAQSALINGWLAAIRIAPHLANNYVGLGTAYQLKGDFVQSERSFHRALQIEPNNQLARRGIDSLREDQLRTQVNLFLDRAVIAQKSDNIDLSLSNYIKALNLEPANPDIHYNIGTAFQSKKDYVRAQKAYSRALELNPNHFEAKAALGMLQGQQQEDQIANAFTHAVKLQSAGNYNDAISVYKKIAVDRPNDDTLFYNLAVAYQAISDFDKSIENYKKAYAIKPDESYKSAIHSVQVAKANKLLARAIEQQSNADNDAAIANYEEVVRLIPSNANAWYNLGTAYQTVGKDHLALEAYKKAYGIDESGQTEAMFFAALILEDQRKLLDAVNLYAKYLKLSPQGDYVPEAKERQEYIKSFL